MNDTPPLYALILAGGVGSRLWPRSRVALPKQMLPLTSERTLLQQTYDRIRPLVAPEQIWVMTNAEYGDLVRSQLPEIPANNVVGEPSPRGTAPAIGLGAQYVAQQNPRGVMVALHADHYIVDDEGFRSALQAAATLAEQEYLVNLGVSPTHPETGYGYVELGETVDTGSPHPGYLVQCFREKPDAESARQYVASGRYLWNSGIFCWRTDVINREFERLLPAIHTTLTTIGATLGTPQAQSTLWQEWDHLPKETTIDHGIMEHAARVASVPITVGWSDIGAWDSLAALMPRDEQGNYVGGTGETVVLDAKNVFVHTTEKLVAVVGVEDIIVVDVDDALLVMRADRAQDVKHVVNELKARGRTDLL